MFRALLALGMLGLAGVEGCTKSPAPSKPAPSASVAAQARSIPPPASAAGSAPYFEPAKPGCRALVVTGQASVEGVPVVTGSLLDGEHWVDLTAGSSVALRHTQTSRELKLIGPARVLPCRHGAEQVLLASGQLSTSANLGVRPGAEVLIATPSGTVHYGDAALDVEFGALGLRVRVKQGEAWVEPETEGKPPFKNPVHGNGEARLQVRPVNTPALVTACQGAADSAQQSAKAVLGAAQQAALGSLGARAAAHMRARAAARSACAMAAAALGTIKDLAENQRLSAAVAHADEVWQSVPHGGSGQKN